MACPESITPTGRTPTFRRYSLQRGCGIASPTRLEPLLVVAVLLGLIALGAPIFLGPGAAGLVGLYLARGSMAFLFAPTSYFGQLDAFELIALPLFVLMGSLLGATPIGANLFRAAIYGAVSGVSVAKLFVGGIVPDLALALALSLYIWIRVRLRPADAPVDTAAVVGMGERVRSPGGIWHALLLVAIVLGSIYSGIATPSEADASGEVRDALNALCRATFEDAWRR